MVAAFGFRKAFHCGVMGIMFYEMSFVSKENFTSPSDKSQDTNWARSQLLAGREGLVPEGKLLQVTSQRTHYELFSALCCLHPTHTVPSVV